MAISVIKQPSSITPSRNLIRWVLQTNNFILSNGVKAVNKFTITGGVGVGQTITFKYGTEEFTMVCSGLANGYDIPIGAYSTAWLGLVLQAFQNNYYLNRDFDITLNSFTGEFTFTAKAVGTAYNMNDSSDTMPNGSFSFPTAGVDYSENQNFKIAVDVYVENVYGSNIYTRLETKFFKPNASSQVDFDIQEELHAFLERETNSPAFNQTVYSFCHNINKRYYIKYCEYYGSTPVYYKQITSSVNRVIKGGVRHEMWPAVANDFRLQYLGLSTSGSVIPKFLITRRQTRTATKTQQEYLYYCPASAITSARLRAKVTYSNNTSTTVTIASYSVLGQGITHLFPAGYTQLNLASVEAGRTPVSWFVYIDNTANILKSEVILYNIVDSAYLERYFIFENSLGAWETLRTVGQKLHLVDTEKSEFQGLLPNDYAATDGDIVSSTEFFHQGYELYTGHYFTKDEANDLIDCLKAEKLFELVGSKKVPAYIEKGTFDIDTDDNYKYGVKFIYRPTYKQVNHGWR